MWAAVRAQDILNKKAPAYSLSKRHCAGRDRNGAEKLGAFVCRSGVLLAVCAGLWHGAGQWTAAAKPGGAGGCRPDPAGAARGGTACLGAALPRRLPAGGADTFFGKNKGRTMEAKLSRFTKYFGLFFFVLALGATLLLLFF